MKRLGVAYLMAVLTLGVLIPACSQHPPTLTAPMMQVSITTVASGAAPATATVSRSDRVSTQGAGTVTARAVALQTAFVEATQSAPPTIAPPTSLSPLPEGRIAFSAYIGPHAWGSDQVFVLDTGGTIIQITHDENGTSGPVLSPDGQWIAFNSYPDSRNVVSIISADGSDRSPLVAELPEGALPTWSPDGKEIIFIPIGLGLNLLRMNPDGTNQTLIDVSWAPLGEASVQDLTWSPDGQWLALTQSFGSGDEQRITLLNLSTHAVVDLPYATEHPAWSPDGRRLAFTMSSADFTNEDIYVMNLGSMHLTRLTDDPAPDRHPTWSPNGRYIAFVSWRPDAALYIMNSDGTGQVAVVSGSVNDGTISWGP